MTHPSDMAVLVAAKAAWRAYSIDAAEQRGHPIPDTFDFDRGWDQSTSMPLSGPGLVRQWTTIARAALSTDQRTGQEVAELVEADLRRILFDELRRAWFAGRGSGRREQYDSEAVEAAWEKQIATILAALQQSRSTPGAAPQWCSGCQRVRSVDCYRPECPRAPVPVDACGALGRARFWTGSNGKIFDYPGGEIGIRRDLRILIAALHAAPAAGEKCDAT